MSIYNILNKLNSLMPKPEAEKTPSKPIYESVEARGSVKQGLEQKLTERYLAEKAVSKSQQQAAGAALAAKRGDAPKSKLKGASKEMMSMSTKELEKFAGTKHKGLPKKKTSEGVDVSDIPAALRKQKGYPELTVKDLKKSKGNLSDRRTLEKMPGGETGRYRKELDENDMADNPVVNAIIQRIMARHQDLLAHYGPEYVMQAIDDVADSVSIADEIGTSDVSGWVRQVIDNLKNRLNQYDEPMDDGDQLDEQPQKEIDYDTLEVDGIDYRDAPEFTDAYFSDGYYTDGTPLSDEDLEKLSSDGDLVLQYVNDVVYEGNCKKSMNEASDYMNDLIKFAKVVRSVETPDQLKVAQRMGQNLLQKYRGMPDSKLDKFSSAMGFGTFGADIDRYHDVEDELYNKKKEMGLSESFTPENIVKFVKRSLQEATGRVHKGKYGTEYQGDDEPEDGETAPRKRGRPAKGEVRKPKAEPAGEKRGRGRPKKATEPKYAGAKELQGWIVGNVPKTAKNLGTKTKHTLPDTVTESVMMVEAGDLDLVLNRFKHEVKQFRDSGHLDDDLYQALLDHYYDAGEMPRTVRNGRTGDPRDWVTERLIQDLGMPVANDQAMAETGGLDLELNELARLAGLDIAESKAKPDFLDLDKDGDKSEPMKKAAADKKAEKAERKEGYKKSFEKKFGGSAEELTKDLKIRESGPDDHFGEKQRWEDDDEDAEYQPWGDESDQDEYDGHADELEFQKWLKKRGMSEFGEGEMEEGNEFSGALAKAKASGAKEFEVDGKTYPVKEQQIDELDKSTLGSYVRQASKDAVNNTSKGGYEDEYGNSIDADRHYAKASKRLKGIDSATDRLTKSKAVTECGDMSAEPESNLNVSTNMSSTGDKNVTISASGDQAEALLAMLKMAGLGGGTTAQSLAQPAAPVEVSMEEEYANEPDTEIQPVDAIVHQGNDLNREKQQYADKPRAGDNPMATMEQVNPLDSLGRKLMQAYESIKAKK